MPFEGNPAGGTTISGNGFILSVPADPLTPGKAAVISRIRPHGPKHHRLCPIFFFSYLKEFQKGRGLELSQGPGWGFTVVRLVAGFLDDYPIGSGSPDHMCHIDPESERAVSHLA